MGEALIADRRVEVEERRTRGAVAMGAECEVEQPLERHPLGRPGRGAVVLEAPLHDESREAGERELVELDLPRRGELRARRLIVK
jgi:hypothetical protein